MNKVKVLDSRYIVTLQLLTERYSYHKYSSNHCLSVYLMILVQCGTFPHSRIAWPNKSSRNLISQYSLIKF